MIKKIILIGATKGGVGKSTVAAKLAIALKDLGKNIGLLDADIYGPSIPSIFKLTKKPKDIIKEITSKNNNMLTPIYTNKIKIMSMGFLVKNDTSLTWRGPIVASTILQFFNNISWGHLDYLIVDLPPGTGDTYITIFEKLKTNGFIIVSTPQSLAIADILRTKNMLDKFKIPIIGIIENMNSFTCQKCKTIHYIFDNGKIKKFAKKMNINLLGEIPIFKNTSTIINIIEKEYTYIAKKINKFH